MASDSSYQSFDLDALRDRAVPQNLDSDKAKEMVEKLNDEEARRVPNDDKRRTYGRTPNGTGEFPLIAP